MNPDREKYLNLRSKPGKVTAEEAGWHLGFNTHEIPILIGAGLLKPLGRPADNAVKFFLSKELDQFNQDRSWFDKACDSITKYWKDRNQQRPTQIAQRRWPHKYTGTSPKPFSGKSVKPRAVRASSVKNP